MIGWSSQLTAQHNHATSRQIKPSTYRSLLLLLILSCAWGILGIRTHTRIHLVVGAGIVGVASLILLLITCATDHTNHLQYIAIAVGASSLIAGLSTHVLGETPWSEGEPLLAYLPICVFIYQCLPISLIIKCALAMPFLLLHILVAIIFYIRDTSELSVIKIALIGVAVIVNVSCLWATCCCEVYSKATFVILGKTLHLRQQLNIEDELSEMVESCDQCNKASAPSVVTAVKLIGLSGMPPEQTVQDVCTKLTQTLTGQKVRISGNCILLLGSCDDVNEHVKACTYFNHTCSSDMRCAIAVHIEVISCMHCLLPEQLLNAETATMQLAGCTDKLVISNRVFEVLSTEDFYINGPKGDDHDIYYEITNVKNASNSSLVLTTFSTANLSKLWKVLEKRSNYIAPDYIPTLETIFDSKDASPFIIMYPEVPSPSCVSPRVSAVNNCNDLLTNTNWDMRSAFYVPRYYPLFNWFTLHLLTNKVKERHYILRNTSALDMVMVLLLAFMVTFLRCVELWPTWYSIILMVALLNIVLLTMVAYMVIIYRYTQHILVIKWIVFIILNITAIMLIAILSHSNKKLSSCIGDIMCILVLLLVQFLPLKYWLVKSVMVLGISISYIIYSRSQNDTHNNCYVGLVSILWLTVLLITCQRDSHLSINLLLVAHQFYHTQCNAVFEARGRCNQLLLTLVPSHILPLLGKHHCYVSLHAKAGLLIIEHADCNEFNREITKLLEKYANLSLCISEVNCMVIMSGTQHLTKLLDLSANIINAMDTPIKMAVHCGIIFEILLGGLHYQLCGNVVNECQNILSIAETGQILLTGDVYKITGQIPTVKLFGTRQIMDTELVLYSIRRQVFIDSPEDTRELTAHTTY